MSEWHVVLHGSVVREGFLMAVNGETERHDGEIADQLYFTWGSYKNTNKKYEIEEVAFQQWMRFESHVDIVGSCRGQVTQGSLHLLAWAPCSLLLIAFGGFPTV